MINRGYANKVISIVTNQGLPLQLSKLIACQSAVETGNFTSHAFILNNNGFGYKHVEGAKLQLPTAGIQSTESDKYAAYSSYDNSILEICRWIGRRQKETKFPHNLLTIQTPLQYATLLKNCGYYGGKLEDYANGIQMYLYTLESLT